MSETKPYNLPYLTMGERLLLLKEPEDFIEIEEKDAPVWRIAIHRLKQKPDFDSTNKYGIRTSKDKVTRVIRVK